MKVYMVAYECIWVYLGEGGPGTRYFLHYNHI